MLLMHKVQVVTGLRRKDCLENDRKGVQGKRISGDSASNIKPFRWERTETEVDHAGSSGGGMGDEES